MSALANRRFLKMNGLGNEITVLDLRGTQPRVSADEARAIAAEPALALRPAHGAARSARRPAPTPSCASTTPTARKSGACGNGTRCVAWAMLADPVMGAAGAADDAAARDQGRAAAGDAASATTPSPSTWARRACAGTRSRCRAVPGHPRHRAADRPDRRPDPALALPPSTWATRTRSSSSTTLRPIDLERIGPLLENHPIFPERANISLAAGAGARSHRAAGLGARRRPDPGLRLGRLRGARRRRPQAAHRPQGARRRCPAATSSSNGARATTTC